MGFDEILESRPVPLDSFNFGPPRTVREPKTSFSTIRPMKRHEGPQKAIL